MEQYYYKYRSLQNLRRFIEILTKQELHASLYFELNDPMEGRFIYDPKLGNGAAHTLRSEKSRTYICSLSRNYNNNLMWAMYADGHCGCCIKLTVTSRTSNWVPIDVNYSDEITDLNATSTVEDILSLKSKQWEHEEETRFIKTVDKKPKQSPKLKIQISEIILGNKMKSADVAFFKNLIKSILGDKVIVRKLNVNELNTGFANF